MRPYHLLFMQRSGCYDLAALGRPGPCPYFPKTSQPVVIRRVIYSFQIFDRQFKILGVFCNVSRNCVRLLVRVRPPQMICRLAFWTVLSVCQQKDMSALK